jgi:uncharacterized phage protein gp47/JayE
MTWPIPQPGEIAERLAAGIEAGFPEAPDLDARAPDTMLGVIARTFGLALFDAHLHQAYLAQQLLPDTATEWLERHADVWGIARIAATQAAGTVTFAGTNGTSIPAGTELRAPSGLIATTLATVVVASGTTSVAVRMAAPGAAGNAVAGVVLALVAPIAGLTPQSATVAIGGLTGGAEAEADEALRARLLARIRQPPMGGTAADYIAWAKRASAEVAQVAVLPNHVGPGTVGVVVAMAGARAPTSPEIAAIAASIELDRPVTASVTVLACVPTPVAFTITVTPDTAATRAAVTAALDAFFAREAAIGAVMPRSRISEAISAAAGEYSHVLVAPAADVAPTPLQLPTRGTITW